MGSTRNGGGGAQEREGRALNSSPHRNRERAVKEEVAKSFRNPSGKEAPAEKTVGVVRPAPETDMVSVMDDPEDCVSGRHSHEWTMEETSEPGGGGVSHRWIVSSKVGDIRSPVGRRGRGGVVRREEGARGLVGLGQPDEIKVGELEAGKGDRGARRIGRGEREGETLEGGENGGGRGEVRNNDTSVSREARRAKERGERVRLTTSNGIGASLNSGSSGGVGLGIPDCQGGEEREINGRRRIGEGTEVPKRGDGVGGGDKTRNRGGSGGDSQGEGPVG